MGRGIRLLADERVDRLYLAVYDLTTGANKAWVSINTITAFLVEQQALVNEATGRRVKARRYALVSAWVPAVAWTMQSAVSAVADATHKGLLRLRRVGQTNMFQVTPPSEHKRFRLCSAAFYNKSTSPL